MEEPNAQPLIRRRRRWDGVLVSRRRNRHAFRLRHISWEEKIKMMASPPPPPLKELMKFAVPTVLGLAMLRYQIKPEDLFEEKPALVWSFVAATAVYWIVAGETMSRRTKQVTLMRRAALVLGIQSAFSLFSMFLPPLPLPLPPFSLLPLLLSPVFFGYTWIRTQVISTIDKVRGTVVRNRGGGPTDQPHALPT